VGVTEDNTDLRGGRTLTGKLDDLLDDLIGGSLEPIRGRVNIRPRQNHLEAYQLGGVRE
jgi:hypothetical protein